MKRVLSVLIALIIFCTVPVFGTAQTASLDVPAVKERTVEISGTTPYSNALVQLVVVKKGSLATDVDDVYFAKQVKSDFLGKFSASFEVNETDRKTGEKMLTAEFTLYAYSTDSEKASIDFEYVHPKGKELALEKINEIKSDSTELKKYLDSKDNLMILRSMDIMIDEYLSLGKKCTDVCMALSEYSKDYTGQTLSENAKQIIGAYMMNGVSSAEEFEKLLENENIKATVSLVFENKAYADEASDAKKFFISVAVNAAKNNEYKKASDLSEIYKQAMVLYKLNQTSYLKLYDDVLAKYSDVLGLGGTSDFKYLESGDTTVRDAVMKNLKNDNESIASAKDLRDALKNAVGKYKKSLEKKDKVTSGGGGGGGGFYTPVVKEEEVKTDTDSTESFAGFNDTENVAWALDAINTFAQKGIISGTGGGKFEPDRYVTRAEFVKMLVSAFGYLDGDAKCDFADVAEGDWSYPYIASAHALGITGGIGGGMFGPDIYVTRQEVAVFAHRAAVRSYLPVTDKQGEAFADDAEIAEWAKRSVGLMRGAGVVSGTGDNMFSPNANATRAEAAKIIYGLYLYL